MRLLLLSLFLVGCTQYVPQPPQYCVGTEQIMRRMQQAEVRLQVEQAHSAVVTRERDRYKELLEGK